MRSYYLFICQDIPPPHFVKTKVSLPYQQKPVTCPYTEPDQYSPILHLIPSRSTLILSYNLCLCYQSCPFSQVSQPKLCMDLSSKKF